MTFNISSRALILLGSFQRYKIVMFYSIGRILCSALRMCSEKVSFPVDVAKSFLGSLNLMLRLFFYSICKIYYSCCTLTYILLFFRIYCSLLLTSDPPGFARVVEHIIGTNMFCLS